MRIASKGAWLPAVLALVLLPSLRAGGQNSPPRDTIVKVGDHVRVQVADADSGFVRGRVRYIDDDSLLIARDSSEWLVALGRAEIARIESEHDEHTREYATEVMATIGLLAGGGVAVANCLKDRAACAANLEAERDAECRGDPYVDMGALLVTGGVLVGGLIGYALAPAPHWDVVMLPSRNVGYDGQQHLQLNVGLRYSLAKRRR